MAEKKREEKSTAFSIARDFVISQTISHCPEQRDKKSHPMPARQQKHVHCTVAQAISESSHWVSIAQLGTCIQKVASFCLSNLHRTLSGLACALRQLPTTSTRNCCTETTHWSPKASAPINSPVCELRVAKRWSCLHEIACARTLLEAHLKIQHKMSSFSFKRQHNLKQEKTE